MIQNLAIKEKSALPFVQGVNWGSFRQWLTNGAKTDRQLRAEKIDMVDRPRIIK